MPIKYPLQVKAIRRNDVVLGVDAKLFAPQETDDTPPLELHSGYSRFVFTIIKKDNGNTITPVANIPAGEIDAIKTKTDIAMQIFMQGNTKHAATQSSESTDLSNRPAFKQKLFAEAYKGKTPGEILANNADEKDNLLKTREWLQANIDKYRANKFQIDAIDDAIKLLNEGKLSAGTGVSHSNVIDIYKAEYRTMSKKDENQNTLIYFISVTFEPEKEYPFTVNITNTYAPVIKSQSGQQQVVMAKAVNTIKASIRLGDTEWLSLITHLQKVLHYFELTNFRDLYKRAMNDSYRPQ